MPETGDATRITEFLIMPIPLSSRRAANSRPVRLVRSGATESLAEPLKTWAAAMRFSGEAGQVLVAPGEGGAPAAALLGLGKPARDAVGEAALPLIFGALAGKLPAGSWHIESGDAGEPGAAAGDPTLQALAMRLGGYRFSRYKAGAGGKEDEPAEVFAGEGADIA